MAFDGEIIREESFITLSTLANITAIKFTGGPAITEDFRILKSEISCFIIGIDDTDPAGGLHLGMCNGDISVADIAGCLRANGPLNRSDRDKQEESMRRVKLLASGQTDPQGSNSGATVLVVKFNNETGGPMITEKTPWTYGKAAGWDFFIYNNSGGSLITGGQGRLLATHYGVWV